MAKGASVWGIEIGQSALKALRCSLEDGEVVVEAFDFIEYPKILSQPEADADELIADAMNQLLERNDAFREKICISVPGQSGLAKFFKPPPVEVKKVADIVRYEARQQIPFDLADVVWDHQMMPGSLIEEGYALESEVGLFAMKREQAYRQLAPFDDANIEVDVVQLAPIALYNMLAHDRLHERVDNEPFDADNPPPSSVLLSIGTDSSDLIITNGFRIWQRSMPIGGNHFTRQLTKDLKLTFAKAEHLKRNAREAVDPKLIFQTMRPVFNDLVTEVQRSIGFFRSIDKKAEIGELLITGNTVKMPGLAAYLGKNLGFEVHVIDRFNRLQGEDVLSIPAFRDNAPTFAVCYGLCLQGLGVSQVHASMVPQEIVTQRMIRAKKPWALAGMAALFVGMAGHYAMIQRSWATTTPEVWKTAQAEVDLLTTYSGGHNDRDTALLGELEGLNNLGAEISSNAGKRVKWLEMIRAVNSVVTSDNFPEGKIPSPKEAPYDERVGIHITEIDTKHYADLAAWHTDDIARRLAEEERNWLRAMNRRVTEEVVDPNAPAASTEAVVEDVGPTEDGWVVQLKGYHFFNSEDAERFGETGSNHVRRMLTTAFKEGDFNLVDPSGQPITFTPEEMGFSYPLLLDERPATKVSIENPDFDPEAFTLALEANGGALPDADEDSEIEMPTLTVRRHDFVFQFVWKPNTLKERIEAKRLAAEKAAEEEALRLQNEPPPEQPEDSQP